MLANTMMPEAFEHGGKLVGVVTTLGFAVAFAIHSSRGVSPDFPDETRFERRLRGRWIAPSRRAGPPP